MRTDQLVRYAGKEAPRSRVLHVAVVQFPLSGDIARNFRNMIKWMEQAASEGAELVQFSEAALSGYYRAHVKDVGAIDRDSLAKCAGQLHRRARELGIWLAYGSTHFEPGLEKPFNSLFLVNPAGEELCRYDKVFLTDTDTQAYSPGNRLTVARIKEFRVGLSICFDMRFPELYRRYMDANVNLVLVSSYQAGGERAEHMRTVAPSTLITRASENGFYLCCANTSEKPSWHEAMVVSFNGVVLASARRHRASMALAELDSRDYEPFTNYIRKTARHVARNAHPVSGERLIREVEEVF